MLKEQSRQWTDKQRHWIKLVTWANIFAQIAFPIAGAFTPLLVIAQTFTVAQEAPSLDQPFIQQEKKNLTDDPKSLSGQLLAENLRQSSAIESSEKNTERWLASTASRAVGMLKNGNIIDNVKSQLHGMAVSEANKTLQNWLQRYGTVKLQANVDKHGRLEGSQFDMLLPFYDHEKQIAFTQFGLRRIDSRTTANFGLGQRHFYDTGMFGYNAFLDHDITRDHTRFGIGAEYARDFMKFGMNGYFRASGWKDGKKLNDYEERPANGFDLRAEGYIPDYPQLGGKLIYEQYFGNEVGLLSEERRQKNPSVFTMGANYTPIPLVTLGIDRKQSAQGHGETQFNFGLNYELGMPWSKQIDPDEVAFKRSLQGGRYDLVERNNQIVLEYRKKELIRLMMENRISGYGGEVIPLNARVSSKYSLKEIVWDTANLEAGGGTLKKRDTPTENIISYSVREGTHYLLVLPPYHAKGHNVYTLSGIAYDNKGNASERAETQIQVIALAIDLKGSGFEPAKQSMLADGKTQTVLRLKLIGKDGKPIRGAVSHITFTSDLSGLKDAGQDPELSKEINEVSGEDGVYEVLATAGTKYGNWKIKVAVDGQELPSAMVDFYPSLSEIMDTDKSLFKVSKEGKVEPNESGFFQLDLRDKDGHIIAGVSDYLTLELDGSELYGNGQKPTLGKVKEMPFGSGRYEWHFKGEETEGRLSVTSKINGQKIKTINVIFGNLLTDIISETHSTFNASPNTLEADNQQQATLTLVLKDSQNQPIANVQPRLRFDGNTLSGSGDDPKIGTIQETPTGSGIYTTTVTAGTKTGDWTVTPQVGDQALSQIATRIMFNPPLADVVSETHSAFNASPKTLEADNQQQATLTLVLKDSQNQPIANVQPRLRFDGNALSGSGDEPKIGMIQETPTGSGIYTATVTAGTKVGDWTVTPQVGGQALSQIATKIMFNPSLADVVSETHSAFNASPNTLEADNQQQATLTLVLKDSQNQPITNVQPRLRFDGSALSGSGDEPKIGMIQETPAGSGIYTATVTAGMKIGDWMVTLQVDGKPLTQIATKVTFNSPVPTIKDLELKVDNPDMFLVVGRTLQVNYKYEHNGGNKEDNSFYAWGEQGQTVAAVKDLANSEDSKADSSSQSNSGGVLKGVVNNGKPQGYLIVEEHAGKVLEFSILARNGLDARTKDILTLTTNDPQDKGNNTKSKIGEGRVANVADAVEVKLADKGKDTVSVNGKPVVKLQARKNNLPNSGGDSINMMIKITKFGKPVAWVPFEIKMSGFDRRNWSLSPDDFKTMLDTKEGDYIGYTDQTGELVKTISDPNGIGARTTLKVVVDGVTGPIEKKSDVIFTVITSPDVSVADYWGHMKDVVRLNGINYYRPLLHKEWLGAANYGWSNNEAWSATLVSQAQQRCKNKLPTVSELQELSKLPLYNEYGWPVNERFTVWSDEPVSGVTDRWFGVNLHNGRKDRHETSIDKYSSLCKE
ncbi:adhesin/invasin [Xenorhabdus vietnamensis]|uniref:Adhesin/invasin n=1 Tax=Xenorhabdus vietnamensis TaxID=351656 RepID=A0A1Y2SIT4_9GAMM|nr:inverse autotransporter beta domain-containing protein [Xenorhabdus vietnamensis]OTA17485.1 adhesin/invasin [Xenorhabdus vietnamensis]